MRMLFVLVAVGVLGCSQKVGEEKQREGAASAPISAQPAAALLGGSEAVPAVVCGIGQNACGARCYDTSKGEKCCPNGTTVCGFGQTCCGERCYDTSKGEKCCPNGKSVCGFGQSCCGERCYDPARGEKCIE